MSAEEAPAADAPQHVQEAAAAEQDAKAAEGAEGATST